MDTNTEKVYRCGWCGAPTDNRGFVLSEICIKEKHKYNIDSMVELVHGECCVNEVMARQEMEHMYRTVTKEMAADAGDPSLEGTLI